MLRWLSILAFSFGAAPAYAQTAAPAISDTGKQYELNEVLVRPKYHQFQIDSAERTVIYHKVLGDVAAKPSVSFGGGPTGGGITVTGGISKLARIISGREKHDKQFVRDFIADQQYRFISLRYTPALVEQMTGLSGDTISAFIAQNPMPYDYARVASDLEVKMWIRTQYRSWKAGQVAASLATPVVKAPEPVASRP